MLSDRGRARRVLFCLAILLAAAALPGRRLPDANAAEGHLLWSKYYNSFGNWGDWGVDIDVLADGSVIVAGTAAWIPDDPGMYEGSSAFLGVYSPTGQKRWSRLWSNSDMRLGYKAEVSKVAVSPLGAVYLLTRYDSRPGSEYLLNKFSTGLSLQWQRDSRLTAPTVKWMDVATDKAGNAYLGGFLEKSESSPSQGGWIGKFNSSGELLQKTVIPVVGTVVSTLTVDSAGNIYAIGGRYTSSRRAIWLAKFSPTGQARWSQTIPGTSASGSAIVVDSKGAVYAAGSLGGRAWVAKYSSTGIKSWSQLGEPSSYALAIALNSRGEISVAGRTSDSSPHLWLKRYSSTGALRSARTYHSSVKSESAFDVAPGPADTLFMTGSAATISRGSDLVLKAFGP